ncbi:tetratricopeptide repeat protein [Undibacterium sp. TJN25]|uniref:tetratricopeptide repeat protein n=1 Tax=Undibacterium sp. TJN25 TaxID=3413056 RepID=UPI003BF26C1F
MKTWITLCLAALLSACASTTVTAPPSSDKIFSDGLFAPPSVRINADDVFALSPEMRQYLENDIARAARTRGKNDALVEALYNRQKLQLEYESAMTRNAAQAFASRSGNCLSLVIMTAAFAREMGINVEYHSVFTEEVWSRKGNINFLSGHVNLGLRKSPLESHFDALGDPTLIIDFLPPDEAKKYRRSDISESTIVSMYMNNRAAESLAYGNVNDAYWWAREAVKQAPTFMSAYNTLGVVYQAHGNLAEAGKVFGMVLAREPENVAALANQSKLLVQTGHPEEARVLSARLSKIEAYPPFYFFDRGMDAMRSGNFKGAKEFFSKEISRAAYYHEFQFWLGIADMRLGDMAEAREHLAIALENGPTAADRNLYSAKLEQMKMAKVVR